MKTILTILSSALCLLMATSLNAQSSCCKANAGIDKTICYGGSVTIGGSPSASDTCASPCDSVRYKWLPTTGLSSSIIANPIASPSSTTNYTLCVTILNKNTLDTCCYACDVMKVTVNCLCCKLGTAHNADSFDHITTSVMPNPSAGKFDIVFSKALQNGTLQVFDVTGRLVWEKQNFQGESIQSNLTGKENGIYILKVLENGTLILNDKIVIE